MGADSVSRRIIDEGECMKNLKYARDTFEKEIGSDKIKELHKPNVFMDVLFCLGYPAIGWVATYFALFHYSVWHPMWWVLQVVLAWNMLAVILVFHDVCVHRSQFGPWGSWAVGMIVTSPLILWVGIGTNWSARHLIHHKYTFEKKDPKLYRGELEKPFYRILYLNGVLRQRWRKTLWAKYDAQLNIPEEYPGSLGKQMVLRLKIEKPLTLLMIVAWLGFLYFRPVETIGVNIVSRTFLGVFDTLRFILEHGDQDNDNPLAHGTFYLTGPISRLIMTWIGGDCHIVHHVYPTMPMYRMAAAIKLTNPVLIKHGMKPHTNIWKLIHDYLVVGKPHGTNWEKVKAA